MQQYLNLLQYIDEFGTHKPAAREGMPGSTSLFGYQMRFDLQQGFPAITTKKLFWKGVVVELLWFLRGDTNIKYLVDNGVNIWNEDAYNYYCKKAKTPIEFDHFINIIKEGDLESSIPGYRFGDCGHQYGKVWRNWEPIRDKNDFRPVTNKVDQIANVIKSLRESPQGRRHIVTAIDPANDNDLALYWCHALFQFNCRPLTDIERSKYAVEKNLMHRNELMFDIVENPDRTLNEQLNENNIPKYYLDCQLYQRSADVFLGVPFNIASYALLTHILAKMCNMIPGEFIHTFGDVHIYDNHMEAVQEQLTREPKKLPTLVIEECPNVNWKTASLDEILKSVEGFEKKTFNIQNYEYHPAIKAELSTGLIK